MFLAGNVTKCRGLLKSRYFCREFSETAHHCYVRQETRENNFEKEIKGTDAVRAVAFEAGDTENPPSVARLTFVVRCLSDFNQS